MAIGHINPGAFHRWLGKASGTPITSADIAKGIKAGGHPAKMAQFAKSARKFKTHGVHASLHARGAKTLYGKK